MSRFLVIAEGCSRCEGWIERLQHAGHQTTIANGVEEGIEAASGGRFDVIVLNQTFGDEASARVLRALRAKSIEGRVILVPASDAIEVATMVAAVDAVNEVHTKINGTGNARVFADGLATEREASTSDETFSYAAGRWANAVVGLLSASRDVRTLEDWAFEIGVSHGTLRNWCRAAHLSPKRSLILGRLLRAVRVARGRPWHPERVLNVTDPRTLVKLLALGGLPSTASSVRLEDLLTNQRLIEDESAMYALLQAMSDVSSRPADVHETRRPRRGK